MKLVRAVRFVLALGICGSMAGLAVAGPPKPLKRPPTQNSVLPQQPQLANPNERNSTLPPTEVMELPPGTVFPTPGLGEPPSPSSDRLGVLLRKRVELETEINALLLRLRPDLEPGPPVSRPATRPAAVPPDEAVGVPPLPPTVNPFELDLPPTGLDGKPAPNRAEIDADFEALMKKYAEWKRARLKDKKKPKWTRKPR